MKFVAWILIVIGFAQMAVGGIFDVTQPLPAGLGAYGERTVNFQLMGIRDLIFFGGGISFIAGCVLLAGAKIVEVLERMAPNPEKARIEDIAASQF